MTDFNDRDLDERIAALAEERAPARDLWPALRGALTPRETAASRTPWLQIAAALALFAAGLLAGRYLEARPSSVESAPIGGLATAAEVQRTGAAYVRALADLRAARSGLSGTVVAQGRGAAIATLEGAAWELKQLGGTDDTAARILALASMDREER